MILQEILQEANNTENAITNREIYNSQIIQRETFTFDSPDILVMKYDNTNSKTRYINFKCSLSYGETQSSNIMNQITEYIEELDSSWNVILFTHVYWNGANTTYSVADYYVDGIATLEHTCDANIIALFVGHVHDDKYTTYTASNGGKLLIISTTTDAYLQNPPYTMNLGTDTEQAFDIVQVDTENRHIYMTRVGAGNDRDFSYQFNTLKDHAKMHGLF